MDAVNLRWLDGAREDHLKAFRTLFAFKDGCGFGGGHALVRVPVVTHPYRLGVRHLEIQCRHEQVPAFVQLAEPLMRDLEAACHRHGENAFGMIILPAQLRDPAEKNAVNVLLRSQVDKPHHV